MLLASFLTESFGDKIQKRKGLKNPKVDGSSLIRSSIKYLGAASRKPRILHNISVSSIDVAAVEVVYNSF